MTATENTGHRAESGFGRVARKRWVPIAAAATAAALTVGAIASAGGGSAGAAAAPPQAQSAGNFLDATLGGKPIDSIAKLKFARAEAPGANGVQNPLDVTVLNAINLPLTGALQLPQLLGITLGAANQVAQAKVDGSSYGASGAVLNSGGVSVGGNNNAFPSNASINLSASGIAGNAAAGLDALGSVKVNLGALSALAQTPVGYAKTGTTSYQIANLGIELQSPALGKLLGGVLSAVTGVLGKVATAAGALTKNVVGCDLTSGAVPSTIDLGFIKIVPATATITVDLEALLKELHLDLNNLPANTDLIALLVNYLTSPTGLAAGIEGVVNGLIGDPHNPAATSLLGKYEACKGALQAIPVLGPLLTTLLDTLISGGATLEDTVNNLVSSLGSAAGAANPLAPLADVLRKLVDIGVNVQPLVSSGDFKSQLGNLPKQGMDPPAVPYSTVVRALEVDVLPNSSGGLLAAGLANAAAGPSNAPAGPPSSTPAPGSSTPNTAVPTGVPAGMGTHGGSPVLPIVLLALGLMFAAGGVTAYRMRGTLNQH